jgi:hypothetical protein
MTVSARSFSRRIMPQTGKYLMLAGLLLVVAGAVVWLWGNKLHWIGRLPGDIRIERENVKIYVPLATMLLASILLSLVLWLVRKLGG